MGRCIYCHGLIGKDDKVCYTCGDDLGRHKRVRQQSKAAVQHRPVSGLTNLVFLGSLAFTAYCFCVEQRLSLPVTLAISSVLLLLRLLADVLANRNSH